MEAKVYKRNSFGFLVETDDTVTYRNKYVSLHNYTTLQREVKHLEKDLEHSEHCYQEVVENNTKLRHAINRLKCLLGNVNKILKES